MQLLQEIIFLQAPNDRRADISGYAVRAVACVANQQLGAEDGLRLSGISRRGHRRHLGDMCPLSGTCRRGLRGQNDPETEHRLEEAMLLCINGVAAGLKNTG